MLVTTSLNDPEVSYWEPAKWVARLRANKTDHNLLLLKTNLEAGHGGASGRYNDLRELAFDYGAECGRVANASIHAGHLPQFEYVFAVAGFDGASQTLAPNAAAAYVPLQSFEERRKLGVTLASIMAEAQKRTADINEARLIIVPPPLIQGIGSAGGYRMIVEDREEHGFQQLSGLSWGLIGKANQTPRLKQVCTLFDISTPRVFAALCREPVSSSSWRSTR